MEQDLLQKLDDQSKKLDAIDRSIKKIRSYLFWTFMVSVILFVLPLLGILIVIPRFLSVYSGVSLP